MSSSSLPDELDELDEDSEEISVCENPHLFFPLFRGGFPPCSQCQWDAGSRLATL